MGGGQSLHKYDQKSWVLLKNKDSAKVLRNVNSGEEVEQYVEAFQSDREYKEAQAILERRIKSYSNDQCNVVKLLEHQSTGSRNLCSSLSSETVYTERIDKRLDELGLLKEDTLVYLLHQSLNGFGHIYKTEKTAFSVTEKMIGTNRDEIIKVWFNQQFSKNEPSQPISESTVTDPERRVVENVVFVCAKHAQKGQLPARLRSHLASVPPKFGQVIQSLKTYASRNCIPGEITQYIMKKPNKLLAQRRTAGGIAVPSLQDQSGSIFGMRHLLPDASVETTKLSAPPSSSNFQNYFSGSSFAPQPSQPPPQIPNWQYERPIIPSTNIQSNPALLARVPTSMPAPGGPVLQPSLRQQNENNLRRLLPDTPSQPSRLFAPSTPTNSQPFINSPSYGPFVLSQVPERQYQQTSTGMQPFTLSQYPTTQLKPLTTIRPVASYSTLDPNLKIAPSLFSQP